MRDDKDAEGNAGADLQGTAGSGIWCQISRRDADKTAQCQSGCGRTWRIGIQYCSDARSGIGELLLVDFDTVDVTNLNRQMYLIPQLGKPKAEALPEILYQINPYLTYRSVCIKVTPDNVKELFSEYPIVCEAFDKPDQKAMLVRELLMQCPKTIVVSGNGMAGYADANEIRTCQVMKRLYVCGDQSTDVGNGIGLIAPRVAVCAAHEANKVLQLIMQTES